MNRSRNVLRNMPMCWLACVLLAGCRDAPLPKANGPARPNVPVDEDVLLFLDYLEPVYQVDESGQIGRASCRERV